MAILVREVVSGQMSWRAVLSLRAIWIVGKGRVSRWRPAPPILTATRGVLDGGDMYVGGGWKEVAYVDRWLSCRGRRCRRRS